MEPLLSLNLPRPVQLGRVRYCVAYGEKLNLSNCGLLASLVSMMSKFHSACSCESADFENFLSIAAILVAGNFSLSPHASSNSVVVLDFRN